MIIKKLKPALSFFILFVLLFNFYFLTASAQNNADLPVKSLSDVERIIKNIVRWTYALFFIAAVFFILMAAFAFLTAGDDAEKINKARHQIIYAVIAIAVALMAVSFEKIIAGFLKSGS